MTEAQSKAWGARLALDIEYLGSFGFVQIENDFSGGGDQSDSERLARVFKTMLDMPQPRVTQGWTVTVHGDLPFGGKFRVHQSGHDLPRAVAETKRRLQAIVEGWQAIIPATIPSDFQQ